MAAVMGWGAWASWIYGAEWVCFPLRGATLRPRHAVDRWEILSECFPGDGHGQGKLSKDSGAARELGSGHGGVCLVAGLVVQHVLRA